jgi:hypothetical protein
MENLVTQVVLMKTKNTYITAEICSSVRSWNPGQLKPILDIFLCGFSLSSCPQNSLKVLLLLNPTRLLKYVINHEQNYAIFIFRSGLARFHCIIIIIIIIN